MGFKNTISNLPSWSFIVEKSDSKETSLNQFNLTQGYLDLFAHGQPLPMHLITSYGLESCRVFMQEGIKSSAYLKKKTDLGNTV